MTKVQMVAMNAEETRRDREGMCIDRSMRRYEERVMGMDIANYVAGCASAARKVRVESALPKLHKGYSRTQELIDHIAVEGPVRTVELCRALDLTSRQAWGMLKYPLRTGKVVHERGVWSSSVGKIDAWAAELSAAEAAAVEAEAVALLAARGWTCLPPEGTQ